MSLELPESLDSHSIIEWAEMLMLIEERFDVSVAELLAEFPTGRRPPVADVDLALAMAEDRATTSPDLYPFRRIGDRLLRAGHPDSGADHVDDCVYLFLRVACLQGAPWVFAGEAAKLGSLFDFPVRDAMLNWMGPHASAIVFGWPPRDGRPTMLTEAVTWLAQKIGLTDGDLDRPGDGLDGGVDCVVWSASKDGRSGIPIWLVQASVEHDVVGKASATIPIESWKRWIKFGAGPVTVFATAHSVPAGSTAWMELNDLAFVIADRWRILEMLNRHLDNGQSFDWKNEICAFASDQMAGIRDPAPAATPLRIRRRKRERRTAEAVPTSR